MFNSGRYFIVRRVKLGRVCGRIITVSASDDGFYACRISYSRYRKACASAFHLKRTQFPHRRHCRGRRHIFIFDIFTSHGISRLSTRNIRNAYFADISAALSRASGDSMMPLILGQKPFPTGCRRDFYRRMPLLTSFVACSFILFDIIRDINLASFARRITPLAEYFLFDAPCLAACIYRCHARIC